MDQHRDLGRLRAALESGPLAQLDSSFRADIDHQLRDAPVAHGVLDAHRGDGAVRAAGGRPGFLTTLLGGTRDERIESDLDEQGVGPRGLRAELRVRLTLVSMLGVIAGARNRRAAPAGVAPFLYNPVELVPSPALLSNIEFHRHALTDPTVAQISSSGAQGSNPCSLNREREAVRPGINYLE